MTALFLELKASAGAEARVCAMDAAVTATHLGLQVRYTHNGVTVIVEPGAKADEVYAKWLRDFNA